MIPFLMRRCTSDLLKKATTIFLKDDSMGSEVEPWDDFYPAWLEERRLNWNSDSFMAKLNEVLVDATKISPDHGQGPDEEGMDGQTKVDP